MQKHTHLVHTAKEIIAQRICAGMAQKRLTHMREPKLEILITQQKTMSKKERLNKMPRHQFSRMF